jgi:hypothetical protein
MRRIWFYLLLICVASRGQITLRLRYGGPSSLYHVRNVSGDTPAVVTVWRHTTGQQEHDLSDGDVVYLQFVPGCREANGYRKVVNSNRAAGTFAITDLNNNPITCSAPFDPAFESGLAGKVGTYTLRSDRPRIFLPRSGDLLTRSKDPDGSGPQVAPVVTENDIPWQRILSTYAPYITPGCDGATRELCPNEEAALDMGDLSGIQGWGAVAAAYAWFADNSKTGYLNLARYLINHVERALVVNTSNTRYGLGFPCDTTSRHCSWGSGADWISIGIFNFALAYDLIRDQLTESERQAFAQKMLNGWGGEHDCENQLQKQSGYANLTQGSKTVTGSGFSVYSPGDGVYFKRNMTWGGTGLWGYVVSVASDSEMTVNFISGSSKTASAPATVSNVDHYKVMPWSSTRCGAAFLSGGHEYNVGAVVRRAASSLATGVGASDTTITLVNAGSFPDEVPFYVMCESEVMLVTARQGSQFTVQRGVAYSTAASHSAGKPVVWSSQLQGVAGTGVGPTAYYGFGWENNIVGQKVVGYLLLAFALADDDPRAADYAESVWNWYYDLVYIMNNKEYWSGPTQGGLQNQGYQWGRWHGTHWRAGLVGRNAFAEGPIEIMDDYFWRGLRTVYLWSPPSTWNRMPYETTIGDSYSNTSLSWVAMAATLWPGEEAARATFWYRNLSGLMSSLTGKNGAQLAAYAPPTAPQIDPRQTVNPWSFHDETDFNPRAYHGLVVSKKDWSDTAGMLIAGAGWNWPRDHTVDQGAYLPGGYSIFKGRKLLFGWDNSYGTGGSGSNWLSLANGSSSLKSVLQAPWSSGSLGGQVNQIDRKHGDWNYVYARGNFTQSWRSDAAVLRNHRHFLHIKTEPEYVIVFDDAALSAARAAKTNLQYFLRGDAASTFSASENYRDITFRKPTDPAAMISTKVLFPDGASPTVSYAQTSYTHKVTFDWGSVQSVQMIAIHRIAGGTTDTMPPVAVLQGLDTGSVGFEVLDEREPVAVVFPRQGQDRDACSFRTNFGRTGRIVIIGLAPGSYRVYRDNQEVSGSPFQVGAGDGTLYLEGEGGTYTVSGIPPATLDVEPRSLRFQYTLGGQAPASQSFRATCTGGTCTASAEENCPWLSVSPQNGSTPVDFTVSVDPQGLSKGIYNCAITVTAVALNSPQEIAVALDVAEGAEPPGGEDEVTVEAVGVTSRHVLVRYGGALKRGTTCTVELSDSASWERVLESLQDSGGLARRVVAFGEGSALEPGKGYYVRANCGTASDTMVVFTRAAGSAEPRAVRFRVGAPANAAVRWLRVDYGSDPTLGQAVMGSCESGICQAETTVQGDGLLYYRYTYLSDSGRELGRSDPRAVAVP